jgi:hypothetical protein
MTGRRDSRTTDEILTAHAEEFLRRAQAGGPDSDVWMGRARDILERDRWPARGERDLKDGRFMMEFAGPYQRCRREERLLVGD